MSSNIVVDIGDAEIVVPDTGTMSIQDSSSVNFGGSILPIIGGGLLLIISMVLLVRFCFRRGLGRRSKGDSGFAIHAGSRTALRLFVLVLFLSLSALAIFKFGDQLNLDKVEAIEASSEGTLSVTTEDVMIEVKMKDEPVFAVAKSKVKVSTATTNGYKLMAYIDSDTADLVNEADMFKRIKNLDSAFSQALKENTWGMSLVAPESYDALIYRGIPTGLENAIPVRVTGDVATEENDATTLYYATYVTPDLDYGRYSGASVSYIAIANVVTDDVVVNYYSDIRASERDGGTTDEPEVLFEDGTALNTVVYGKNCSLGRIDVSGDCDVVYVGDEKQISKSANIDDQGRMVSSYEDDLAQVESVTFSGADLLKVDLIYATESGCDVLYLLDGGFSKEDIIDSYGRVSRADALIGSFTGSGVSEQSEPMGSATLFVDNDTITFAFTTDGSVTSYGYYAVITPVFFEKPANIETTESTLCRIAEYDITNGTMGRTSYAMDSAVSQVVTIPGADKVRVEISYNIGKDIPPIVISGEEYYQMIYSSDEDLEGSQTFDFDGDKVAFSLASRDSGMVENYMMLRGGLGTDGERSYGFHAEVFPIYNEETGNTLLTETCSFERKDGGYKTPTGFNYWSIDLDTEEWHADKSISFRYRFYNEYEVISFLNSHPDYFDGRVVNLYAVTGGIPLATGSYHGQE